MCVSFLFAMKILYLDYDGVIHDSEVFIHPKRGIYIETPGRILFEWMPILEDLLLPHPDVRIVLSTSWVPSKGFSFARRQLSKHLQNRVIGATYHNRYMRKDVFPYLSRGAQITSDVARRLPDSWFAIDDDVSEWPEWCLNRLVQTNGTLGISCPDTQERIRSMLNAL